MNCLICGNEMEWVENFMSYVPASDDDVYFECRHCGLRVRYEDFAGNDAFEYSMMGEKWVSVPEGCLLVLGLDRV